MDLGRSLGSAEGETTSAGMDAGPGEVRRAVDVFDIPHDAAVEGSPHPLPWCPAASDDTAAAGARRTGLS